VLHENHQTSFRACRLRPSRRHGRKRLRGRRCRDHAARAPPPSFITPPPGPVANWTGPYVGGIIGYLRSPTLWEDDTFGDAPQTLSGMLAGVEAGYRFQAGNLVFGIEGDWAWTNADGAVDCGPGDAYACATDFDWIATITGTAGFAIGQNLLVYAEAGVAFADQNFTVTGPALDTMTGDQINRGWVIGGGAVAQLGNGLYIKGEYNYINFGTDEVEVTNGILTETSTSRRTPTSSSSASACGSSRSTLSIRKAPLRRGRRLFTAGRSRYRKAG
jgi:outer membrane immunogenic protein